MKKTIIFAVLAVLVLGLFAVVGPAPASATEVDPVFYEGNPTCIDLGFDFGFKDDNWDQKSFPYSNSEDLTGDSVPDLFWSSGDGKVLDWNSTVGIDAVIMKSQGANVYFYDPEALSDTGLISPETKDISHVEFCYDWEVDVSKDANTTFTRTYNWDISKSVTPDTWDLFTGDSGTSQYTVSVDKTGYTDSAWAVAGTITIENNTPFDATITDVSDVISGYGGAVSVDCGVGVTFPYILASGATLECSYSTSLPDGSSRTNTATVTTSGIVGGDEDRADVIFGDPTTEVNKEINVTDTNGQSWGPVSDDTTWTYDKTFACDGDAGTHDNTATIVETEQSTDPVSVTVNCYALEVTKDADTSFNRYWTWTIDKTGDQTELTLSVGQQFLVNYEVTVGATSTDGDWAVNGTISVTNPAPMAATINSVSDVVSPDIAATVDCGVSFPYSLAAGGTLNCTYSASLPNANSRTNTATATLQNYAYDYQLNATPDGTTDFSGTAGVAFGTTPADEIDECIDVSDTYAGVLGTVCYGDAPTTFTYSRWIGPYATCGDYTVENTASFVTNDTGTTDSDGWTINVNAPCVGGCTLTQGYWKTHSEYGPAPYDDTWAMLSNGADTPFFGTGYSYYEILWMAPKGGNAYLILAHQYIAAELNQLNGAYVPPEVQDAMDQAEALLIEYEGKLSIPKKGGDRALAIELYGLLDDYNNGLIGPGHCSE
jgi:hypothetical protein